MMWRRLLMLDVALAAVITGGVVQVRKSWDEFEKQHRTEAIQPEKETVRSLPPASPNGTASEDWTDISVKNPFSFDRNDVAIVAPKQTAAAQPKPVLFGVMSIGNEWIAMMGPGQGGGRGASRPVKVGETMDTWEVVEIKSKSVIVTAANGNRETIIMNDPTAQVARSSERTATGGIPAPVVSAPAPQSATTTTQSATTSQSSAQSAPNQPADEILQTPFGPVKRTRP